MTVKLYALSESVARKAAAACGVMTHGSSVNASAMEEATRALGGPPLTPGAAIVTALFPDVDATVLEALGRLVDVWPLFVQMHGVVRSVAISRAALASGESYVLIGNGTESPEWQFSESNGEGLAFGTAGMLSPVLATDPAAVVAAIEAVIRRVEDAK